MNNNINMMDSLNNEHAKVKNVILKLLKGKESAARLRTLLRDPGQDDGSVSFQELGLQILRSFTETLSELSCCDESTESKQIAVVGAGDRSNGGSVVIKGKRKNPGVKDRRGCYKRRKNGDSWTRISDTNEDGCAWRKYGQKPILNSLYPRCYFRCKHQPDGCKALRQVQKIREDPTILFQITYFNHHTCTDSSLISTQQILVDSDPVQPNLLSFKQISTTPYPKQEKSWPVTSVNIYPTKADTTQSENFSDAKSSLDLWQDIVTQPDLDHSVGSYKPSWDPITMVVGSSSSYQEAVSGFNSCGSVLDYMEVDQLDDHDIDSFYLNDIYN